MATFFVIITLICISFFPSYSGHEICKLHNDNSLNFNSEYYQQNPLYHSINENWSRKFGGPNSDCGYSVIQTNDKGYIITGYTESYGEGGCDVWLIKTDSNGIEEWNKTFGGMDCDIGCSIIQTVKGGYAILGKTSSYGAGKQDVWLIKTDSNGTEEWNNTFGGKRGDGGCSLQQTSDEGFVIAGDTQSYSPNFYAWIIKTDSKGVEQWNTTLKIGNSSYGNSIIETENNEYIITGNTCFNSSCREDIFLVKLGNEGNEVWNKTFGGTSIDEGRSVQQTNDGGFIITGYTDTLSDESFELWLIKTDSDGNEEWNKTFGGSNYEIGNSVRQTNDGGYIIVGIYIGFYSGRSNILLIKTDNDGNKEWDMMFGKSEVEDRGESVQQTSDGGYIITGFTGPESGLNFDVVLLKVAAFDNQRPNQPMITGKTKGRTMIIYDYKIVTTDPEGDDVYYFIDWDSIGSYTYLIGPYASGEEVTASHYWRYRGDYSVKVMAIDVHGGESDWTYLEITIPKIMTFNSNFNLILLLFERFNDDFPFFKNILKHMK